MAATTAEPHATFQTSSDWTSQRGATMCSFKHCSCKRKRLFHYGIVAAAVSTHHTEETQLTCLTQLIAKPVHKQHTSPTDDLPAVRSVHPHSLRCAQSSQCATSLVRGWEARARPFQMGQ